MPRAPYSAYSTLCFALRLCFMPSSKSMGTEQNRTRYTMSFLSHMNAWNHLSISTISGTSPSFASCYILPNSYYSRLISRALVTLAPFGTGTSPACLRAIVSIISIRLSNPKCSHWRILHLFFASGGQTPLSHSSLMSTLEHSETLMHLDPAMDRNRVLFLQRMMGNA